MTEKTDTTKEDQIGSLSNKEDSDKKTIEVEYITPKGKAVKEVDPETKKLKGKIKKLSREVDELKKKMDDQKDDYLRQAAEKENLRKRLEREKTDFYQYALADLLKEFLVILDNFERAMSSQDESKDDSSYREGIEMIYKQFLDLLIKQGVTPIEIEDQHLDPHLHQAFMTEESEEVDEPKVSEELQKGYRLHDRLLRPSFVKVLVPKKGNSDG